MWVWKEEEKKHSGETGRYYIDFEEAAGVFFFAPLETQLNFELWFMFFREYFSFKKCNNKGFQDCKALQKPG